MRDVYVRGLSEWAKLPEATGGAPAALPWRQWDAPTPAISERRLPMHLSRNVYARLLERDDAASYAAAIAKEKRSPVGGFPRHLWLTAEE